MVSGAGGAPPVTAAREARPAATARRYWAASYRGFPGGRNAPGNRKSVRFVQFLNNYTPSRVNIKGKGELFVGFWFRSRSATRVWRAPGSLFGSYSFLRCDYAAPKVSIDGVRHPAGHSRLATTTRSPLRMGVRSTTPVQRSRVLCVLSRIGDLPAAGASAALPQPSPLSLPQRRQ